MNHVFYWDMLEVAPCCFFKSKSGFLGLFPSGGGPLGLATTSLCLVFVQIQSDFFAERK